MERRVVHIAPDISWPGPRGRRAFEAAPHPHCLAALAREALLLTVNGIAAGLQAVG
jgi:hypothetical protein